MEPPSNPGQFRVPSRDRNGWVEVYLLHARNLLDFFASEPTKDDVVASHYIPSWDRSSGGEELAWLEAMRQSINKRLAHVTAYRRRTPKMTDAQSIEEIGAKVEKVWHSFVAQLPAARVAWFGELQDEG
jgi:hypothetical protein